MNHQEPDKLPRAISYARFSSGIQAKGSSMQRQEQAFAAFLEQHKDRYQPLYFKDAGISAFKGKNAKKGDLSRLKECITEGTIKSGDVLVVEAIDRLSRQGMMESFDLVRDILGAGVGIITLENNQTCDAESLNGSAIYSLIASLQAAHAYSKRLGSRVAAAHENKRAKARAKEAIGKVVTAPWLKDGKLFEPFASLVKKAVDLYLSGYGYRAIAILLNIDIRDDAILFEKYGNKLNASTVSKWLKSNELIGHWNSKEGLIENCLEPLISNLNYVRLQQENARRLKVPSKSNDYKLAGLVRCKVCSAAFHTRIQKPKPTLAAPIGSKAYAEKPAILYCNCSNYLKNGSCNNNSSWSYGVLQFIYNYGIVCALSDIYMHREKEGSAGASALNELEEQIANAQIRMDAQANLYQATNEARYLDSVKQRKLELDLLKAKKDELEVNTASFTSSAFKGEIFDLQEVSNLPLLELRALLKQFNYQILVDGKTATLSQSPEDREVFTLGRRLQKYQNCYLVKVELPEVNDPLENNWVRYYAIGKNGEELITANSEAEVLLKLERI